MKEWSSEQLEQFAKQVNIILAEEQSEQEQRLAQNAAYVELEKYKLDPDPQGYAPDIPGVWAAKDRAEYKEAARNLATNFGYNDVAAAKADLNEARQNLINKYMETSQLDKAMAVMNPLGKAGGKPYDNPVIFSYLMDNIGKLNQVTKDALLVKAVEMKNADAVNKLADAKAKITDKDLRVVIENEWCKDAELEKLIKKAKSVSGGTVADAVEKGVSDDVLKALASKVKEKHKELRPALIQSVGMNNNAAAKILLDAGVNPSPIQNGDGNSLLVVAIKGGNEDLIGNLINATALEYKDLVINGVYNDADKRAPQSALQTAIQMNKLDIAQTLIDNGANVNFINKAGETALYTAVSKGNVEAAQFLLLNGANIHIDDQQKLNASIAKSPEMKTLFDFYQAVELDLKESFVPRMDKMIEVMKYMEGGLTSYNVMQEFDKVLKAAYDTDKSFAGSFAKNGEVNNGKFAKEFRLSFIEEALITIQSAFQSIFSEQTYQQIKFGEMAEAIYNKIKDTPKFQELAAPGIGKVADVALGENKLKNAEETGLKAVLGKHTAKYLGAGSNAPSQGRDVTRG